MNGISFFWFVKNILIMLLPKDATVVIDSLSSHRNMLVVKLLERIGLKECANCIRATRHRIPAAN